MFNISSRVYISMLGKLRYTVNGAWLLSVSYLCAHSWSDDFIGKELLLSVADYIVQSYVYISHIYILVDTTLSTYMRYCRNLIFQFCLSVIFYSGYLKKTVMILLLSQKKCYRSTITYYIELEVEICIKDVDNDNKMILLYG